MRDMLKMEIQRNKYHIIAKNEYYFMNIKIIKQTI